MTQARYLAKDLTSVLDIGVDWSLWLKDDTILLSDWSADDAITITRQQASDTVTSCYISGGVLGAIYKIVNKVTTVDGKVDSRHITVTIKDSPV